MKTFAQFDNLIPQKRLRALQDYFAAKVRWQYGWPQGTNDPYSHWSMDFLKVKLENQEGMDDVLRANPDYKPLADVWEVMQAGPMRGHQLVRCYANAHTYGVEGFLHSDSPRDDNYTSLLYLNPVWKKEWAGELLFFDGAGEVFFAVSPKPGRVLAFSGNVVHAARAVARACPAIRVSVAFKSRLVH